jgi:ABC-2 type transport system permease protein
MRRTRSLGRRLSGSGKQSITVTVPHKPTRAGIDPYHLLIDLTTGDNLKKVKIQS